MGTLSTATSAVALASMLPPIEADKSAPLRTKPNMIVPPSDKDIMAAARFAFADHLAGQGKLSSGEQRMAYAVMCEHASLVLNAGYDVWLSDHFKVTTSRDSLNERMVDVFTADWTAPVDGSDEQNASFSQRKTAFVQLIKRGVSLAAILTIGGITFDKFNAKLGLFPVPARMLHPKDATPAGRLKTDATIMLDQRPVVFIGKNKKGDDKTVNARASIAHLRSINAPSAKPRQGSKATGDKATADKPLNTSNALSVATAVPLRVLIGALYDIIVKQDHGKPMPKDAMPLTAWNELSAIMQAYDKSRASWEANKPVAAKLHNRKPAKAA